MNTETIKEIIDDFPGFVFYKDKNLKLIGCSKSVFDFCKVLEGDLQAVESYCKAKNYGPCSNLVEERQVIDEGIIIDSAINLIIDEKNIILNVYKYPIRKNGVIIGLVSIYRRLSDIILSTNSLLNEQMKYFNMLPNGVVWNSLDGKILGCNKAILDFFHTTNSNTLVGKKYFEIFNKDLVDKITELDNLCKNGVKILKKKVLYKDTQGNDRAVEISKSLFKQKDLESFIFTVIIDITKEHEQEQEMSFLATHDKLTGLYNRVEFEQFLGKNIHNKKVGVVMIDVDGLKLVNDIFGHLNGDEMLINVANVLQNNIPDTAICARLGGDEFGIVLSDTNEKDISDMMIHIADTISKVHIYSLPISISYGAEVRKNNESKLRNVIAIADAQMYRYKNKFKSEKRKVLIDGLLKMLYDSLEGEQEFNEKVEEVSRKLATYLGYSEKVINQVAGAAKYHNIGKVAVDAYKVGQYDDLDFIELNAVKKHPEIGYIILSSSIDFVEFAEPTYYHHMFYDGTGYPGGVKGTEIPVTARMLTLSDFVGFLMTRNDIDNVERSKLVLKESGTRYDPVLCKAMSELLLNNKI